MKINRKLQKIGNSNGFYVGTNYVKDGVLKEGKKYSLDIKEVKDTTFKQLKKIQNKRDPLTP